MLMQPLKLSNGNYEMTHAKVALTSNAGDAEIAQGAPRKVTQVKLGSDGYDEVHNLKISVDVPIRQGAVSTNGSYSGGLVLMFEPAASAGGDTLPERGEPPFGK
ncbi:hypothetical protein [Burkholderia sp. Bp8963]|uniref:hypothetical protein n=1 Tax=Burkholderia sp. Bp8963 TaxID=2184547 RepID=UPI0021AB38CD|nr:hypothetical protein [Burkholderia sp. Bp8963]